jgi:hypothetical protein
VEVIVVVVIKAWPGLTGWGELIYFIDIIME